MTVPSKPNKGASAIQVFIKVVFLFIEVFASAKNLSLICKACHEVLSTLDSHFETRELRSGSKGGEFSNDAYFSGPMGAFGGLEYRFPNLKGLRFKAEYDGIDYTKEGFEPGVKQRSRYNFGFHYPLSENLSIKLGYVRGNTLNIGFSFKGNFMKTDSFVRKRDPKLIISNSDETKEDISDDAESIYGFTQNSLQISNFSVNEADLDLYS